MSLVFVTNEPTCMACGYLVSEHITHVGNTFCPTGKGGGIDPTCGKGGAVGGPAIASISRVGRNGEPKKDGKWIQNPIPRSELESEMEIALDREVRETGMNTTEFTNTFATEENVSIDQLTSGQTIVDYQSVEHFVKNPSDVGGKLPLVIQYKNEMLVRDGNTRISAKKLAGETKIKARVLYVSGATA